MSEIKVDTLTGKTSAGDITVTSEGGAATMQLQQGLAKFWITHDGTGTPTTIDSFGVTSIVDVGTGNYKYNFQNNFATAKGYWTLGTMNPDADHNGVFIKLNMPINGLDILTSSVETSATFSGSSTGAFDYQYVSMLGFGDLS